MTTHTYQLHTGDGSAYDRSTYSSRAAAVAAVRSHCGWPRCYLAEHGQGGAWSAYGSLAECRADQDGAFAPTITRLVPCRRCGNELPVWEDCGCCAACGEMV